MAVPVVRSDLTQAALVEAPGFNSAPESGLPLDHVEVSLLPAAIEDQQLMTSSDDGKNQACASHSSEGHAANGVEHGGAGIGLSEERGASRGFGECARVGILVCGDTDERGIAAFGHESAAKFDAGDLAKMNVEHQAVELGMFLIREEFLS